jgi:SagB-type dehydrogenase family enzyme
VKFRRAPSLVSYWHQGRLLAENFTTGKRVALTPLGVAILDRAGTWQTPGALARAVHAPPGANFTRVLRALERATLIERQGARPASLSLDAWGPWLPHAGLFHFGTKDQPYLTPRAAALAHRAQSRRVPCPPPTKSYPARRRIALPSPRQVRMPLDAALLERRTWRRFSRRPAALADIATVLGLTWGVQQHATDDEGNRIVLKTSPSGGATHPIEVYVAAFNVAGLPRGIYHYDAARYSLTRVRSARAGFTPMRYLPRQPWYRGAAALFLMTAVVGRETWKYATARAYRALLIDAGHLTQTCCLVATAIGLGPFCSMALDDSSIERDLGIDGVSEIALYAAGCGALPQPRSRGENEEVRRASFLNHARYR